MSDNSDLFNAALMWYMQQQANKPPKFYNVPLTPFQQWQQNQTQGLYNYAGTYSNQLLSGLNGLEPKGFQFVSQALKGQPFAGGMQLPKFDFSHVGTGGAAGGATGVTGGTGGTGTPSFLGGGQTTSPSYTDTGSGGPGHVQNRIDPSDDTGNPNYGQSIYDYLTQNPGANLHDWFPSGGGAPPWVGTYGNDQNFFQAVSGWWSQFQKDHPDWVKMGWDGIKAAATAAFGPLGTIVTTILGHYLGGNTGGNTTGGNTTGGGSPSPYVPPNEGR